MVYFDENKNCVCVEMDARNEREAMEYVDGLHADLLDLFLFADFQTVQDMEAAKDILYKAKKMYPGSDRVTYDTQSGKLLFVLPEDVGDPYYSVKDFFTAVWTASDTRQAKEMGLETGNIHRFMQAMLPDAGEFAECRLKVRKHNKTARA